MSEKPITGPGVVEIIDVSSDGHSDEVDEECENSGYALHHGGDCDVDSDTGSDDSNEDEYAEDEEYVWTIKKAKRFHLSEGLAVKLGVDVTLKVTMRNLGGDDITMDVRKERIGEGFRYAVKGWPEFMRSNGISVGDNCTFAFLQNEGKLALINISK